MYLLVHTCEVKLKGWQGTNIEKMKISLEEFRVKEMDQETCLDGRSPDMLCSNHVMENEYEARFDEDKDERMVDQDIGNTSAVEGDTVNSEQSNGDGEDFSEKTVPGVLWDIFRHQDVPKLIDYLRIHWKEFGEPYSETNDFVSFSQIFLIFFIH